jgi:LPLT family lysophospholipid transporter-like MFS transporter
LITMDAPAWMTPLLKFSFALSYVILAAFVGAFADSRPKGKVMFFTNLIKISGCALMFVDVHPVIAYGVVGFGAAAYSPAKYGILTELLPPEKLVAANGWIEGLTISSIILGVVLGGKLIDPQISAKLLSFDFPIIDLGVNTTNQSALCAITVCYVIAAIFNRYIPDTGARYHKQESNPIRLFKDFAHCSLKLWQDKLGQISLAVTTLFWGAGATLQYLVLKWAEVNLHMPLSKGSELQGVFAVGIAIGALFAARVIPLKKALSVMPLGVLMGLAVTTMIFVTNVWLAYPLLIFIGGLAGFFVVPMNALLQHRGHVLMSAGHSIAVQNFNENLSILVLLAIYAVMVSLDLHTHVIIVIFGLFVASTMYAVILKHKANQKIFDSISLIGEAKH